MNPYASLAGGQYSNDDVMAELKRSAQTDRGYAASLGYYPGANFNPRDAYPAYPAAFTPGSWAGAEDKKHLQAAYGNYEPQGKAISPPGFQKAHWGSEDEFLAYFKKVQQQDYKAAEPGQYSADLFEGAVDVQYREGQVVAERMLDMQQEVFTAVKPIYTYEKIVEIPQVIVKETTVEVPKPEIIERILEVPKTEIQEHTIVGPPQVQYQEQIVEVPRVVVEERVIHVPRREIQERLIEVPKVQYVYRDEYEDFIEYREVPVDKIVEVPEIEYRVRHVEKFVDQTYIQEYYTDKYKEIPVTQVQEVERVETIPMTKEQMAMMGGPPSPPVPPRGVIPYTTVQ